MKPILLLILMGQLCATEAQTIAALKDSANAQADRGNYGKAINLLNKALQMDSTVAGIYDARGFQYIKLKDFSKAYDDYSTAIRLDPDNYVYYFSRAQMLMELSYAKEALPDFKAALQRCTVDSMRAAVLVDLAQVKIALGKIQDPEGDLRAALALDSNNLAALPDLAMFVYERQGYNEESIRLLQRAIRLDPKYPGGYGNLAFIYGESGRYRQALDMNEELVRRFPDNPYALNNRGFDKFKLGDLDGALEDINNSLVKMPENSYAYRNRALVLMAQRQKPDACRDLSKAQDLGYEQHYGTDVKDLLAKDCPERPISRQTVQTM
ncbi:MAG TPA: tetratricopeptide repeat protein [Dinghuibacter sp.]|uniref:tetratricopeptide repeat protein n=1 Tax=Dinghuibacter sp. TaxID=2024697 RepID=UPI002CFBF7DC|nr:tetratricopeptide repeat protein [Dinghuibacter sp.]HTJ13875.1 tetratricopeptide repeat protein [Dinghuibacter sp.]